MDKLKQVADSIKEDAQKTSADDPILKEAVEECKKPCTKESIEEHTCAQMDVCCAAYGNSKCIRPPGQPSFAEQQTGVRLLQGSIAFMTKQHALRTFGADKQHFYSVCF